MIISGGVNVYPQEIEAALREAPGVWDVAVVGLADPRFGERPVAFVVPDLAHGISTDTLRAALLRHAAQRLSRIKQPDAYHFVDELPRSATGKLLRRRLRARLDATPDGTLAYQPATPPGALRWF